MENDLDEPIIISLRAEKSFKFINLQMFLYFKNKQMQS